MKRVILIGTVHLGWTPKHELAVEILRHSPDKLLIELTENEVRAGVIESIRDEMFAALEVAQEHQLPYSLFDTDMDTVKAGVTGKEPEFVASEEHVKALLGTHDWKSLNDAEPWEQPEIKENEEYIVATFFDTEKMKQREEIITKNILGQLVEGTNVVVTGCGHLTHLLKDIPHSSAPLRSDTALG